MPELFSGDISFADYTEAEYGDGWFCPAEYEIKVYDGYRWVSEGETTDHILLEMIRQDKMERPQ